MAFHLFVWEKLSSNVSIYFLAITKGEDVKEDHVGKTLCAVIDYRAYNLQGMVAEIIKNACILMQLAVRENTAMV